jgi:hypothetical protein
MRRDDWVEKISTKDVLAVLEKASMKEDSPKEKREVNI